MAKISNNTPSTEGHIPPPPNVLGAQKLRQSSSCETKTEKSTESTVFYLEAAWGTETMDVSLKVGAAGFALILALALLTLVALVALAEAVAFTTYLTPLKLWVVVTILALLWVLLSVVVDDIRGSADVRSGH